MTTVSKPQSYPWRRILDSHGMSGGILVLTGFAFLLCFASVVFRETSDASMVAEMTDSSFPASMQLVRIAGVTSSGHMTDGNVNGVPYDHCAAHTPDRDIVLLHGAKFSKDDWKTSTIMPRLCAHGRVSVTALDLSVQADGKTLQRVLQGLAHGEGVLQPEGNYVVVTPSASGKSVVDWINHGDHDELVEMVGLWVPIASPAISTIDKAQLTKLRDQGWPILALYGDQDAGGKRVSEKLAKEGGAKVKEFPGSHPFYFDIPDAFTEYLLNEIHAAA